ncbi:hypothetical protein VTI28DRAFT_5703 [Corynascus sepedonium]
MLNPSTQLNPATACETGSAPSSGNTLAASVNSGHSSFGSYSGSFGTYTYNIDRFEKQAAHEDGTVHGRIPDCPVDPTEDNRIELYKSNGSDAIEAFDVVFQG